MKKSILFLFTTAALLFSIEAIATVYGSWEGKLQVTPSMALRFVINVNGAETDTPVATMDSPDQGAYGIPMKIDFISSDSLNVYVNELTLSYRGKIKDNSIVGRLTQGGQSFPLTLTPKTSSLKRPQTPQPPFDYSTEEVVFKSELDNARLVGTLTTPAVMTHDTPVMVLISGSGVQNRDEEIFEHRPFAVIADYFARNGIASLRYDDRGFDKSSGLSPNPTTYDNAMDAKGAIKYLKEIGAGKIGLVGHSEGGLIADILAKDGNDIDFVIEIGGPATSGDKILIYQNESALRDNGLPEEYIELYLNAMNGIFQSQKGSEKAPFEETEYELFSPNRSNDPIAYQLATNLKENFINPQPWLRYFINYDPIADIQKISVPMMFIYGENDTQVPPSLNVPVLSVEKPSAEVKIYPKLNHLMQHSVTGKVTEYAEIEETFSVDVLKDMTDFIKNNSILKTK